MRGRALLAKEVHVQRLRGRKKTGVFEELKGDQWLERLRETRGEFADVGEYHKWGS